MSVCVKCKKPIVFPDTPKLHKFSETKTVTVVCPNCGTVNTKTVKK